MCKNFVNTWLEEEDRCLLENEEEDDLLDKIKKHNSHIDQIVEDNSRNDNNGLQFIDKVLNEPYEFKNRA